MLETSGVGDQRAASREGLSTLELGYMCQKILEQIYAEQALMKCRGINYLD
jgi:hypothetical protein